MPETNWERAYRYREEEYKVLRRTGMRRGSKLYRLHIWANEYFFDYKWVERAPDWLIDPIINVVATPIDWLHCLIHNHTPLTEMDNRTIVCAICGKKLGVH